MRRARILLACALVPGVAVPLRAQTVLIELHQEALLNHPHMVLADLATVSAADPRLRQAVEALRLGSAPLAGYEDRRSRAELDLALRGLALAQGQKIEWRGASSVQIRTESRMLDGEQLGAAARQHVLAVFGPAYEAMEVSLAGAPPEVMVPAGPVELKARAADPARPRARMPVWVDVLAQGAVYRSVVVTLNVSARQQVYVARRALAADSMTSLDDYQLRLEEVTDLPEPPVAPGALGVGRLRLALAEGQVLTRKQLTPADMVLHGDRLRLLTGGGGISIETSAIALADAAVGQMVRVQPDHGSETVVVRVISPGVVSFDGR